MPRNDNLPYCMKSVLQELLAMSLAEEPSCEIEIGVISRFESFRIVQNKIFVFIGNKFVVGSRFSSWSRPAILHRAKTDGYSSLLPLLFQIWHD